MPRASSMLLDVPLERRQGVCIEQCCVPQPRREQGDRIALLPLFDFGLVAIQLGVEHRMRPEPIGAAFEKLGAIACPYARGRSARGLLDRDHVHTVDRVRADAVSARARRDVRVE
jgi:hypothetical protein